MRGSNAVWKFSENASVLVASTGPYPMCVQIFRVLLRGIHSTGSWNPPPDFNWHCSPSPIPQNVIFLVCFYIRLRFHVFWNGSYTRKIIFIQLQEYLTPPSYSYLLSQNSQDSDSGIAKVFKALKCIFETPHNEIKCVLCVIPSNSIEKRVKLRAVELGSLKAEKSLKVGKIGFDFLLDFLTKMPSCHKIP